MDEVVGEKCPQVFALEHSISVAGTVWGGHETFTRWCLARGSPSLGVYSPAWLPALPQHFLCVDKDVSVQLLLLPSHAPSAKPSQP